MCRTWPHNECLHILLSKTFGIPVCFFLSVSTKFQFVIISQCTCPPYPPIPPSNSIVLSLRKNKASKNENINIPTAIYCEKSYVTNRIFVLTINLINRLHMILSFYLLSLFKGSFGNFYPLCPQKKLFVKQRLFPWNHS